ncbi:3D domain-containing protein [Ulvibacterium sp.]|uniref:3D domain-containing protein n=1 Tax=Ulvibacterium sp. TaxID=2665914 RepID=UPI003BAD6438
MSSSTQIVWFGIFTITLISCNGPIVEEKYKWIPLEVTATAYNSFPSQTLGNPAITAWGDTLVPGTKAIAISRDLLEIGLKHNTPVQIQGFSDTFYVMDKMHKRWKKRIDIYMGENYKKAKEWGRKKVQITYAVEKRDSIKPD